MQHLPNFPCDKFQVGVGGSECHGDGGEFSGEFFELSWILEIGDRAEEKREFGMSRTFSCTH